MLWTEVRSCVPHRRQDGINLFKYVQKIEMSNDEEYPTQCDGSVLRRRARPGLEPGTTRIISENPTNRPMSLVYKYFSLKRVYMESRLLYLTDKKVLVNKQ